MFIKQSDCVRFCHQTAYVMRLPAAHRRASHPEVIAVDKPGTSGANCDRTFAVVFDNTPTYEIQMYVRMFKSDLKVQAFKSNTSECNNQSAAEIQHFWRQNHNKHAPCK